MPAAKLLPAEPPEVQSPRPAQFPRGLRVRAAKLRPVAPLAVVPKPLPPTELARSAPMRSLRYQFLGSRSLQVRRRARELSLGPGRNPRPNPLRVRADLPTGLTESRLPHCQMARGSVRTPRPLPPPPVSPSPRSKCSGIDATRAAPQLCLALPLSFLGVISVLTC